MDAGEREITKEPGKRPREATDAYGRPRRPWLLIIASLLLAAIAAWTGAQWKQAKDQDGKLRAQASQSQQRVSLLEKQVMALSAEREATTKRLEELEAELSAAKARLGGKKPATPAPTKPAPKR